MKYISYAGIGRASSEHGLAHWGCFSNRLVGHSVASTSSLHVLHLQEKGNVRKVRFSLPSLHHARRLCIRVVKKIIKTSPTLSYEGGSSKK